MHSGQPSLHSPPSFLLLEPPKFRTTSPLPSPIRTAEDTTVDRDADRHPA